MEWETQRNALVSDEAARAAAIALGCDDDDLEVEPNGRGGVILKRRQPAKGKENEPMSRSRDNDEVAEALTEAIGRMSASDQRTLKKFLAVVTEEVDAVKKDASSDFLNELRAYFEDYLRQLGEIPSGEGNPTDPKQPTRFAPGRKPMNPQSNEVPPVIKSLGERLMRQLVKSRPNLIVAEQDDRGLTHNPARDARESAAARDMAGERMAKGEGGGRVRTGGVEVQTEDLTTDPVRSAQAERDRVAAQRRG